MASFSKLQESSISPRTSLAAQTMRGGLALRCTSFAIQTKQANQSHPVTASYRNIAYRHSANRQYGARLPQSHSAQHQDGRAMANRDDVVSSAHCSLQPRRHAARRKTAQLEDPLSPRSRYFSQRRNALLLF